MLYGFTARNLYTYYKADIYAYVMVMQNINRELVGGSAVPTIALPSWQMLRLLMVTDAMSKNRAAVHIDHGLSGQGPPDRTILELSPSGP